MIPTNSAPHDLKRATCFAVCRSRSVRGLEKRQKEVLPPIERRRQGVFDRRRTVCYRPLTGMPRDEGYAKAGTP
jgi:hypothetical protein